MSNATNSTRIAQLEAKVLALQSELAKRSNEPTMSAPPLFDGRDPSACREFLCLCTLNFTVYPHKFPTEESKIYYAISHLRGPAFKLVQPYMNSRGALTKPDWMKDFEQFEARLNTSFGLVNEKLSASRQIQALTQTQSVYEYYVEFISLAAFIDWHENWLISQFYSGLKPRIKDEIDFLEGPDTLEELRNLAIQIDERFYEREKDFKGEGTLSTVPYRPFLDDEKPPWITLVDRPAVHADPPDGLVMIDIDTLPSPRGPLSAQERDRRRELNLCLYCGQPGHIRINCPVLDAQKYVREMKHVESFCQVVLKDAMETQEGYDQNGSAAPDFKPGDLVLYKQIVNKTYGPNDKLEYKVLGPFKVLEKIGRAAFRLDFPATVDRHPVIHVSQLERYHQNEPSARQATPPPAEKSPKTKARGMRPKKS